MLKFTYDMISVGDATIDTFMQIDDASIQCRLTKKPCQLCINYADKIVVHKMKRSTAGNAANNAIGSSRLGMKTTFCTIVGDDENGDWILKKIKDEKVTTKYCTKQGETNASTVINFQGERTILVYHAPRIYKLPRLPKSEWMYYTSVGEKHKGYNKDVVSYIKKYNVKLGYNPGSHQLKAGLKNMKPVLKVCEVIFINKEEAARIVGPKKGIKQLQKAIHKLGPKKVVITDGSNGVFVYDGSMHYQMGILDGLVVERTGAGDSFAAGFIAGLHYGASITEAMCWGSHNATAVIGKIGPQAGLLTKKQMLKAIKKSAHCKEACE